MFIRTTGCNLRCVWCDSEYAFYGGTSLSIEEVITRVESYGCRLVEITGGEPLLQKAVPELTVRLLEKGFTVLVETSGEQDISVLDARVIKIMDIKCPGSGECEKNRWQNLSHLGARDEVKFVIKDRVDYEWAAEVVRTRGLEGRFELLFSPVFGELNPLDLVQWILADGLQVRLQLQMHKFIWPPDTKGV